MGKTIRGHIALFIISLLNAATLRSADLTVSGNLSLGPGSYVYDRLVIPSGASLVVHGAIHLQVQDLELRAGGSISGFGLGSPEGCGANGAPNSLGAGLSYDGGGGHGGVGGSRAVPSCAGAAYDSVSAPAMVGSGGGHGYGSSGGAGGAALIIDAAGSVRLDGNVDMGGSAAQDLVGIMPFSGGGGAGGTLSVYAAQIWGQGSLGAPGGKGGDASPTGPVAYLSTTWAGGGGGGGRIELCAWQQFRFSGSINVAGGATGSGFGGGMGNYSAGPGGVGSIDYCGTAVTPTPAETSTFSHSPTISSTSTATPSQTPTPSPSGTRTSTVTRTFSSSPTHTLSFTASPSFTSTSTITQTRTHTPTMTVTPLPTGTASLQSFWQPNGPVYAVRRAGNRVYIGGDFTAISSPDGSVTLARGHGAAFDLGSGQPTDWDPQANARVRALAVSSVGVYIGGEFTSLEGQSRGYAGVTDPVTGAVASFDPQFNGIVRSIDADGDYVGFGGDFDHIFYSGSSRLTGMATVFNTAGSWLGSARVSAFAEVDVVRVFGGYLYAGGLFTAAGPNHNDYLVVGPINGTSPVPYIYSYAGPVRSMLITAQASGFIGGDFVSQPYFPPNHVSKLDNGAHQIPWSPVVQSPATVMAMALNGSTLYLAGTFIAVGYQYRAGLAAVDALGSGAVKAWNPSPNGLVRTMDNAGGMVFIGGDFTQVLGRPCAYFAAIYEGLPFTPTPTITLTRTGTPTSTISPTFSVSPTVTPSATATPTATASITPGFMRSGIGRSAFGPLPARRGASLCLYSISRPRQSECTIYNSAAERVAKLTGGMGESPCLNTSAMAPGIYWVRGKVVGETGGEEALTQTLVILP